MTRIIMQDIKDTVGEKKAVKLIRALYAGFLPIDTKRVNTKYKHRFKVETTMHSWVNVYDLDEVIRSYENKILNHNYNRLKKRLEVMLKDWKEFEEKYHRSKE